MKPALLLLGVILIFAATPILRAQLVHIQFTNPDDFLLFRATDAGVPWNQTTGSLTRLDLYFDMADATVDPWGDITFSDPTHSFWQAHIEAGGVGPFDIRRPIDSMQLWSSGLYLNHAHYSSPYESFELSASFVGGDPASPFPTPGSVLDQNYFNVEAGSSFFAYPDMMSGYGTGSFRNATITVSESSMTPVPEPGTFSLGALIVLVGAMVVRFPRTRRSLHSAAG